MTFGLPRDPAQWLALALAIAALAAGARLTRPSSRPARFAALAALSAAALSAAYVAVYLRGGPRIIDATSYFLEARAIAEGRLAWPIEAPETSVLGRFLVRSEWPDGARAAVIFPPGYPALLALGFLSGAPLAVGPLLAAAVALVTFDLARLSISSPTAITNPSSGPASPANSSAISIPQLALLFSVACAALRYHTADTMSHGLAALCSAGALALALRARDALSAGPRRALALASLAGLAAGWLFATRPVSALALAPILALALASPSPSSPRPPARALLAFAAALLLGALPGALLFFAHQRAATGAFGLSSQRLYYALSDGPADCFRYGFGAGVGCVGEHGDFVRARLASGYGALEAIGTTLRRLKLHLVDPANLEPLALLVPAGAIFARRHARARLLGLAVIAQIAAYFPFYFDGNYPGGGARLYADVLPFEHVLLALAVAYLAARARAPQRFAALALALALAGFAFRAGFDHAQLRDRDGGRPMFDPAELARAGVAAGLVFVDTDHGFNLGFDPAARATPAGGLEILRHQDDALDRLAWEARGRPPAFLYRFDLPAGGARASSSLTPLAFPQPPSGSPPPIEAESLWPPVAQHGGFALREHAGGTCASSARWLAIHPDAPGRAPSITVEVPAPWAAGRTVSPRVAAFPSAGGEVELTVDGASAARWRFDAPSSPAPPTCVALPGARVPRGARRVRLTIRLDAATSTGSHPQSHSRSEASAQGAKQGALAALDRLDVTGSEND